MQGEGASYAASVSDSLPAVAAAAQAPPCFDNGPQTPQQAPRPLLHDHRLDHHHHHRQSPRQQQPLNHRDQRQDEDSSRHSGSSFRGSEVEPFSFSATPPLPPPPSPPPPSSFERALGRHRSRSFSQASHKPKTDHPLFAAVRKQASFLLRFEQSADGSRATLASSPKGFTHPSRTPHRAHQEEPASRSSFSAAGKRSLAPHHAAPLQSVFATPLASPTLSSRNATPPRPDRTARQAASPSSPLAASKSGRGQTVQHPATPPSSKSRPRSAQSPSIDDSAQADRSCSLDRSAKTRRCSAPSASPKVVHFHTVEPFGIAANCRASEAVSSPSGSPRHPRQLPHRGEVRLAPINTDTAASSLIRPRGLNSKDQQAAPFATADVVAKPSNSSRATVTGLGIFASSTRPDEDTTSTGRPAAVSVGSSPNRPDWPQQQRAAVSPLMTTTMPAVSERPSFAQERSSGRADTSTASAAAAAARSSMTRDSGEISYPNHIHRAASRSSYLPTSDTFEARRAVSPSFIEGPISSLSPPDSAWRPHGQDAFWQRPHIGVGLPTAYHHERPPPRFVERTDAPSLPKAMTFYTRPLDDTSVPVSSRFWSRDPYTARSQAQTQAAARFATAQPQQSFSDPHHPQEPTLPEGRQRATQSHRLARDLQRPENRRDEQQQNERSSDQRSHGQQRHSSVTSFITSASTEGRGTASPGPVLTALTANTSTTSFFQSRSGHDTGSEGHVFPKREGKAPEAGPPTLRVDAAASERAGSNKPASVAFVRSQAHGASRTPVLSPIAASSQGERSNNSRSTPNLSLTAQTAQLLEQMRIDELRAHSVVQSGYLEPNNGCETVFFPRPRLRSQSVENILRNSNASSRAGGTPARKRQRQRRQEHQQQQRQEDGPFAAGYYSSDQEDLAPGHTAWVDHASPLSNRNDRERDTQSSTLYRPPGPSAMTGSPWPVRVPARDSSMRTDHARTSSNSGYSSDSDVLAASHGRPFFHHRMPPAPPKRRTSDRQQFQQHGPAQPLSATRWVLPDPVADVRDFDRGQQPSAPPVFEGGPDADAGSGADFEVLDLKTVQRRGSELDAERAAWRLEHQRSLNFPRGGMFAKCTERPDSREGSVHHRTASLRALFSQPVRQGEEGAAKGKGEAAAAAADEAGGRRVVWTDKRMGRSFLMLDDGEVSERARTRLSTRSSSDLQSRRSRSSSARLSIDPSAGMTLCSPMTMCRTPTSTPRTPRTSKMAPSPATPRIAAKKKKATEDVFPSGDDDGKHGEKQAGPQQMSFGQRMRAKSLTFRTFKSSTAPDRKPRQQMTERKRGERDDAEANKQQQPVHTIGRSFERSLVSDEPVVISRFTFPAPPDRRDGGGGGSADGMGVHWTGREDGYRRRSGRRAELTHLPGAGTEQLADAEKGDYTSGGESSQVGLALSTPSDQMPVRGGTNSDMEALVPSVSAKEDANAAIRTLPSGRYAMQGYHRPTNSDEIRAQLGSSLSSSLRNAATLSRPSTGGRPAAATTTTTSKTGDAGADGGAGLQPSSIPLPPSYPTFTLPVPVSSSSPPSRRHDIDEIRLQLPPQGSSDFDRNVRLRTGSSGADTFASRSSLPVPPRKARSSVLLTTTEREEHAISPTGVTTGGPFRTPRMESTSGGGRSSFGFTADDEAHATPRRATEEEGALEWSCDLDGGGTRDEDDEDAATQRLRPWPSRDSSNARDGRRLSFIASEARWIAGGANGSRASSIDGQREVWDPNEACIDNLFFRPPPPLPSHGGRT